MKFLIPKTHNAHMLTFVQATYVLGTFAHISIISAVTDLILTKLLGPKFLQQYLSCYQPHFDQTFGTQFFGGLYFCGPTFLLDKINFFYPKFFWTKHFWIQFFWITFFGSKTFWSRFWTLIFFRQKMFWT